MEDDLLLECSMEVFMPNRRKKLDEKLTKLFDEFSLSCKKGLSFDDKFEQLLNRE